MDSVYHLAMAISCAAGLLALFALLRRTLASSSAPGWLANDAVAYISALALTLGFAGSLFYVGSALQPFVPAAVAFVGTFAIHFGFVALCLKMLPVDKTATSRASVNAMPVNAVPG